MQVRSVRLKAFRNHRDTQLQPGPGITLILGNNGQGKTNVLEAISYLSLSKSFYAASDAQVVMIGEDGMEVRATIVDDGGHVSDVRVLVDAGTGKKLVSVNGADLDRISDIVGMFPAVILSPEHYGIVAGGPAERRKFLDIVLCQSSRTYLADMLEYRRVLRQRNKLLLDARLAGGAVPRELPAWTDELVRLGSRVMHRRALFVNDIREGVTTAYNRVAGTTAEATVEYLAAGGIQCTQPPEEIALEFAHAIDQRAYEERKRGSTLVGPHRDDLAFAINSLAAERYASQGEQKTLLIALKLAEFDFVATRSGETPILLLDDVFAELDRHRAARVIERLTAGGQCIITATDAALIGDSLPAESMHRRILVESGTCHETPV
jgi:DNA replication and repair protein RecF